MPTRPPRACSVWPCAQPAGPGGRCATHQAPHTRLRQASADRERGSASARLYGWRWHQKSRSWLRRRADELADEGKALVCEVASCGTWLRLERSGAGDPHAAVVDHRVPHRGDPRLFWDETNWRATCRACNTAEANRWRAKREIP